MEDQDINKILMRIEKLERAVFGEEKEGKVKSAKSEIDFSLNERAFVKRYAFEKSGPKRFTLLVAYIAKGEVKKCVALNEIKKLWGKMSAKTFLGEFNMFYPNDAKTRGWVDSPEYGCYCITNEWKDVLWMKKKK